PYYYELCRTGFIGLARGLEPGTSSMLALKFAFAFLIILIPTILMGGTLPVLTKLVTRSLGELRERVAALYFINRTGAVAGCVLADFWWIPEIGFESTVWAGAALNLLVGAVALFLSGWLREGQVQSEAATVPVPGQAEETFSNQELRLAIIG